jgi:diphthamide biosynthesis methyltransferase
MYMYIYIYMYKVVVNKKIGLHTLCLLDIKVKEQSEENMAAQILKRCLFISTVTSSVNLAH